MAVSPVAVSAEIRLPDWLTAMPLPPAPASDETCMAFAVAAAAENVARGTGGPFGAVVRDDASGEVIGVGVNLAVPSGNPVLHAETVAISLAGSRLEAAGGLTLFTSCEPCIMCLGAAHWASIRRIVSAASRKDAEAVGFSEGAGTPQLRSEMAARGVVFEDGLLREGSSTVLRTYIDRGGVIYGPR
ncbi:MAG: nucleoside deaminase [Hyphomonadaceae bacterium]